MSVTPAADLMSINNTDGSLKTRQQWNADLASVTYSVAEQAQLDAVEANSLASYISPFAYQTSVQGDQLMNNIDTSGKKITANSTSFGPTTLTSQQVALFSQAKQQGGNPTNPTDLLDMIGVARSWDGTAAPATATIAAANTTPTTGNTGAINSQIVNEGLITTNIDGKPLAPNITMSAPTILGGGTLSTDAAGILYFTSTGGSVSPVTLGSDVYRQVLNQGVLV